MKQEQPRRVLIVVQNLPVPPDRRVWLEATTLARAGYTVSVLSPTGRGHTAPYEFREGVHIYRFEAPREAWTGRAAYVREWATSLWRTARLAPRIRRERGFDVIHGCNPPDLVFLIAWMFRLRGVRYLFDHHDVCPELYIAKFDRRGFLWRMLHLIERINFATAQVVLSTNDSFRALALSRGGMAPEDVFVVRSAPRVETFVPRAVPRPPDDPVRFGYVGVIGQQEGMDLLVQAIDHLVRGLGYDRVHFDIVGFGPQLEAVKADAAAHGLDPWITFHGPLFDEALLDVLNRMDIGISPDPKNEMNDISTMNKIMEYMTLEKPLVQFALKEGAASAGEAALYATPNDPKDFAAKMAALIDDPERRAEMGRIGRQRVLEHLSWEHSTRHLLAAYDRIFAR